MSDKNSKSADLTRTAVHEFQQLVAISLYLAFFFCAVATYRMLLNDFRDSYFNYLAGLINALVIAKVILIGEYAHLGKKYEHRWRLFEPYNVRAGASDNRDHGREI